MFLTELTFFGLTSKYMESVYEQFFLLKHFGGWSFVEIYNLPIGLRDWFVKRLQKQYEEEAREIQLNTGTFEMFRNFLFTRVMHNLKRIGLLTDEVRPKFEALGLLEYENAPDDFECDWAEMKKPLEKFGQIPTAL